MLKDFFNFKQKSLFSIHDSAGLKLLSRLRLKFGYLNEHKFCHNFKDALSSLCDCGCETETTDHFFLRCPFFTINRQKLFKGLLKLDLSLRNLKDELLLDIILRTLLSRKYFFIQLVLSNIPSALKDHCLTTNLLLLLLFYFLANFI